MTRPDVTRDKVINWPHAKGRAEATIEGTVPDDLYADVNLARAYLALLEAVAPLLEMEPWLVQGPWERFRGVPNEREADFFVAARNTADALRDLLTGGEA